MKSQICELDIDSKPFSFEVKGDFSWGKPINTFIFEKNIISKTKWINDGYTIVNNFFESQNEFKLFQNEVKKNIIKAIKLNNIQFDENKFKLENYHQIVKEDYLHNNIIKFTRNLTEKDFSLDLNKLLSRAEDVLNYKLSSFVKELNKVHIQIRISRPNTLDINPPHKDGYLNYWKDIINIWMPISGCNSNSSLPLLPGSHLWPENEIYRTQNKGAKINNFPYHVPCILKTKQGKIEMIRPNPEEGDAIFFTPFLIHGAAFNVSKKTRIGMELRFPKL
jgi:ectoine hydroxylase-related dioxygenase (phytanoyl-CoA dioxygenase family)